MVSVLMCTYNREKFLARAIDSVLNQTYKDLEFIIVDDGSTDGSEALVRSYVDPRIRYLKLEQNSFYCYAANCGLGYCKGDYVAFINSDDEWLQEKLERQVHFLENHREYGACFSAAYLFDNEGKDVTDENPGMRDTFARQYASQKECLRFFFERGNSLCHPSALVRKDVLDQVGGFNLMYCQTADYELWVRIVSRVPVYVTDERLLWFRWDMKAKSQVSSHTIEHTVRTYNEQSLIRRDLLDRLTDEQVTEYFREDFRRQDSASHLEVEFERCFLLMKSYEWMEYPMAVAMERLERVLNLPGAMDVLRDHFQINIFDIYARNKAHLYLDPWKKAEEERQQNIIARQQEQIEYWKRQSARWKRQAFEYADSTSWKLTEPLRRLGRKLILK